MQVYFLNGPPGSGKDTAADYLVNWYNDGNISTEHTYFKKKVYAIAAAIYGITTERMKEINDNRDIKNVPSELFDGLSPRQALIKTSEEVIKPIFGNDFFSVAVLQELKRMKRNNVQKVFISDCGFPEEVERLLSTNEFDCTLIQFYREGCTFEGDSRSYINWTGDVSNHYTINNDDSIDEFYRILRLI